MARFIGLLVFLFLSLLTVCKAPAYPFWLAAIFVAEYGYVFVLVTVVVLLCGFYSKRFLTAGTIAGLAAIVFFVIPVIRAEFISGQLAQQMDAAFAKRTVSRRAAPFSVARLLSRVKQQPYQSLTFTSYRDTALTLDFYKTNIAGVRPCIILIHGGSWSGGDSRQLPELNSVLAQHGYQVASVNYRLAPKHPYPAAVQDVRQAIRYLKSHAARLSIDTSKLVLLGRSAGGQLALLAAYQQPDSGIKGVIDFYGPADMVWGYSVPANPLVFDSRQVMRRYLGGTPQQTGNTYAESSPIEYVNSQSVPTLMIHGENDVLVAYRHSTRLNAKLQQYHVPHYLLTIPWATHGFDYHLNGPGGQLSTYAVLDFLRLVTH